MAPAAKGDFSSGFSFDLGGVASGPAQSPWEFKGAIEAARQEHSANAATTIDHKIQRRLLGNKYTKSRQNDEAASEESEEEEEKEEERASSSEGGSDEEGLSEEEDGDEGVSSGEDAPLPGEVDESDDEEEEDTPLPGEVDESDSEEEEGASEGVSSGEESEEDAALPGKVDESDDDIEEEEGDDENEEEKGKRGEEGRPVGREGGRRSSKSFFSAAPRSTSFASRSFADLNLSRPLVKACEALGYTSPTPIQAACVPIALAGRDICGSAITGSGKTAAFGLPLLERLQHRQRRVAATYVLVLTPTRELAVQVHSMLEKLGQFTDTRVALVVGGLSLHVQTATLRSAPEIVVATPGRLIDHLRNSQSFHLEDLATLVLDEADRLLEMGFAEEVKEIVRTTPTKRQTLLFSATMTEEVRRLAALSLRQPIRLAADTMGAAPKKLRQEVVRLKGTNGEAEAKEAVLLAICSRSFAAGHTIIFAKTKQRAHRLKILFGLAQLPLAVELHGNMTQAARLQSLERFRSGEAAFLIATDVAARGLDILGVQAVVNFDFPATSQSYLHRIGRTARAGAKGVSVSFVEDSDRRILKEIVKATKAPLQARIVADGVVRRWHERIETMEPDVLRILKEERLEKELRQAEMEADKATNMIEHESEIMARPKRTWFQTEKQKRLLAQAAKLDLLGDEAERPKNAKDRKKEKLKAKRVDAKQAKADAKQAEIKAERDSSMKMVRAAKAKETQFREAGVTPTAAGKMAAAAVDRSKKRKKAGGSLFEGDGVKRSKPMPRTVARIDPDSAGGVRVYAGGGKSKKVRAPKDGLSVKEKKAISNKGRGHHSFKSKARHKRK